MKIVWACPPGDLRDSLDILNLLQHRQKSTIALGMGDTGLLTRILAKKFGGHVSFCALDEQAGTAPGQVSIATMKGLYHWDQLGPTTKVYGVIGWPVGHSMSPSIHNAGFEAVGFDGVYLPMPISPGYESFAANLQALLNWKELDFRGASVTIPHKENLLRFVQERRHPGDVIEPLAQSIGAANTLVVREDGSLAISNTDYAAALDAVCQGMGISREALRMLAWQCWGQAGQPVRSWLALPIMVRRSWCTTAQGIGPSSWLLISTARSARLWPQTGISSVPPAARSSSTALRWACTPRWTSRLWSFVI
ncbi:MAG: type I 3-dehydroquinate dehydratase [Phycisphaerales bacterium]|nr:type I 3-dehydroquinate dehydratase [Phycisphaerales bacterium]